MKVFFELAESRDTIHWVIDLFSFLKRWVFCVVGLFIRFVINPQFTITSYMSLAPLVFSAHLCFLFLPTCPFYQPLILKLVALLFAPIMILV